ncbi:hypothetical protein DFH07DRAFT_766410 [Mycena maculata]|uniref:Uncharacterized protein n=1 Tax=Mycena maculata TaxID=230809 RepID=A0AAD7K3S7_9AGAR|nr:hypothetical protein DFH07DRAFT_766410 [Mycena maculata]
MQDVLDRDIPLATLYTLDSVNAILSIEQMSCENLCRDIVLYQGAPLLHGQGESSKGEWAAWAELAISLPPAVASTREMCTAQRCLLFEYARALLLVWRRCTNAELVQRQWADHSPPLLSTRFIRSGEPDNTTLSKSSGGFPAHPTKHHPLFMARMYEQAHNSPCQSRHLHWTSSNDEWKENRVFTDGESIERGWAELALTSSEKEQSLGRRPDVIEENSGLWYHVSALMR